MKCKLCDNAVSAMGLCHKHYERKRRSEKREEYRLTRLNWYKRNKKKVYEWRKKYQIKSIKYMHKARFGGLREQVIERDNGRCVICGMSRQEHRDKWGRDITVNHINLEGRNSTQPDNSMQNLETLCLSCHSRKDYYLRHNLA